MQSVNVREILKFLKSIAQINPQNEIKDTMLDVIGHKLNKYFALVKRQNEDFKPRATYRDLVLQNPRLVTTAQIADDYAIPERVLNIVLARSGIQYKDEDGVWRAYPRKALEDYIVMCEEPNETCLKWTQRGRLYVYEVLKAKGFIPICEGSRGVRWLRKSHTESLKK